MKKSKSRIIFALKLILATIEVVIIVACVYLLILKYWEIKYPEPETIPWHQAPSEFWVRNDNNYFG